MTYQSAAPALDLEFDELVAFANREGNRDSFE
jgi:hypothetical protein